MTRVAYDKSGILMIGMCSDMGSDGEGGRGGCCMMGCVRCGRNGI